MTADGLHIGHIKFLMACKDRCVILTVGIMTDDCVVSYKGSKPIMSQWDRERVIKSIRFVNNTTFQSTFDFPHSILTAKEFWAGSFCIFDSEEHMRQGADLFIPRTAGISSTMYKGQDDYYNLGRTIL